MKEKTVAKAYAKAIYELGETSNVNVADELTSLTEVINSNNNLENLLFLDVFTVEEKKSVMDEIFKKMNLSAIVTSFVNFLFEEKRVSLLPMIIKEVIVLDDHKKGFLRGTIEGSADSVDEATLTKLKSFLNDKLGLSPELNYVKNEKITAGVKVTVGDYQLDASLDKQLNEFKNSIINS